MTSRRAEIDCATGKVVVVKLSRGEIAEMEARRVEEIASHETVSESLRKRRDKMAGFLSNARSGKASVQEVTEALVAVIERVYGPEVDEHTKNS